MTNAIIEEDRIVGCQLFEIRTDYTLCFGPLAS